LLCSNCKSEIRGIFSKVIIYFVFSLVALPNYKTEKKEKRKEQKRITDEMN